MVIPWEVVLFDGMRDTNSYKYDPVTTKLLPRRFFMIFAYTVPTPLKKGHGAKQINKTRCQKENASTHLLIKKSIAILFLKKQKKECNYLLLMLLV